MTPEEIDRTIEFLIEHAATFSAGMDALKLRQEESARRQVEDHRFLVELSRQNTEQIAQLARQTAQVNQQIAQLTHQTTQLTEQTGQFQSWASEVVTIESRRVDEHDRLHQDARAFQNEAIRLLHRILDRLPPAER